MNRVRNEYNRKIDGRIKSTRHQDSRVNGKVYKMVARPAMMYSVEMVTLAKRQAVKPAVAEMKIRFHRGDQDGQHLK